MLVTALYTKLSTDSGITAIAGTRIYPVKMPQEPTFPLVTYQIFSQPTVNTHDAKTMKNSQVQVDAWAETFLAAHQLAEAIESSLGVFKGTIASDEVIHSSIQRNKQDFFEDGVDDYRVSLDFSVWHTPI